MSETYTKLFGSITLSTIWTEDDKTRIVWITMLALADRVGYVGASLPGLAASARISVEATKAALEKFLAPDPFSRSSEFEGRRIAVADRGWILLNYERFRDMRDEEARKEFERHRKREQRARKKVAKEGSQSVPDSPDLSQDVPQKSVSYRHKHRQIKNKSGRMATTPFDIWWAIYPLKVKKDRARTAYTKAAKAIGHEKLFDTVQQFRKAVDTWPASDRIYIPHPTTWLNDGRFHDDPSEWLPQGTRTGQAARTNELFRNQQTQEARQHRHADDAECVPCPPKQGAV